MLRVHSKNAVFMTNQVILSIQSAVMHGAVGNNAAMPIYQYLQQPAEFVNTVQLAAHPGFGSSVLSVTPAAELDALLSDYAKLDVFEQLGAIQTGYFGDYSQIAPVAQFISTSTQTNETLIYLLDPVLGDAGRLYVDKTILSAIRTDLLPHADIITPNQFELSLLAETVIQNEADAVTSARQLLKGRLKTIFTTGVTTACGQICDILVSTDTERIIKTDKRPKGVSGSGDVLSAFFLNAILSGQRMSQAAQTASAKTAEILGKAETTLTMPILRHFWEKNPKSPS
jgi:pyridoxine kinase